MRFDSIDVTKAIDSAKEALVKDKTISSGTKATIELLITIISLLLGRLKLNSTNSSKPPSSDTNKDKKPRKKTNNSRGGQKGHDGVTLNPVKNPDKIKNLSVDKRKLPRGKNYKNNGYLSRQVIDIKISKIITEYRAERLIDDEGVEYIAEFPGDITRPIQYGASVKAAATHLSTYQLIPYERIQEQFRDEYSIPLSTGSLCNFNAEASALLLELGFDSAVKHELSQSIYAHADETSINLEGKKIWLHNLSNDDWTWFVPHAKRGTQAINDIGIIPAFSGVLCHDHWKPYYKFDCTHALCNAHHLRELTRAGEIDGQQWAKKMHDFLTELNIEVGKKPKKKLSTKTAKKRREKYAAILAEGDLECPAPSQKAKTKRKPKRSKSRNLLERLREYKNDVLRFMVNANVPFTNNQGERDLRMIKVQQKISGCFRSMDGAVNFCRVRSYLSTCKKNGISASEALETVFNKKLPDFIQKKLDSS